MKSHGWEHLGKMPLQGGIVADRYMKGDCRVLISKEPHGRGASLLWHLSISCADRYPTWEEIKDARYNLLPLGATFAQILPPPNQYVNIHDYCFHLWELEKSETPFLKS